MFEPNNVSSPDGLPYIKTNLEITYYHMHFWQGTYYLYGRYVLQSCTTHFAGQYKVPVIEVLGPISSRK